ncbi:hypothetical protein CRE_25279 [Caenorhabditis remanei]|uniref:Uncharacterized protein n=1 Tax=Caenorhabditis remanei TaxID=31234 RepID=E3LSA3_CAERE|nr:hypothetical protein CRE_25279 [Caenorhabditis remanei]
MIGSTRLLILFCATLATSSAMGWFGGNNNEPTGCESDWPEDFPQEPEGFNFKCKCPCKCKPRSTTAKVESTQGVTTPASTIKSSTVTSTTTRASTPSSTSTSTSPSTSTSASTPTSATTRPTVIETEVKPELHFQDKGASVIGGEVPVVFDESSDNDGVNSETGTTFWIRSPTPPNTPEPVVRGGAAFTVGGPQYVTVKIDAPSAPDAALNPHEIPSGEMDFDIKNVATPKAPRAVVDPDA